MKSAVLNIHEFGAQHQESVAIEPILQDTGDFDSI